MPDPIGLQEQYVERVKDLATQVAGVSAVLKAQDEFLNELGKETEERKEKVKNIVAAFDKIDEIKKSVDGLEKQVARRKMNLASAFEPGEKEALLSKWVAGVLRAKTAPEYAAQMFGEVKEALITKDLQADTGSGSHFVPKPLIAEVIREQPEVASFRNLARVVPMTSDKQDWPSLGAVTTAWQGTYGTASVDQTPTTNIVSLVADTLIATVPIGNQLLQDATPDIVPALTDAFREVIMLAEEKQGLLGTGAGADPFTGIGSAAGVQQRVMVGAAASTKVVLTDITGLIGTLISRALAGARFFASRTLVNQFREINDGQGRPIFGLVNETQTHQMYGFPVVVSDQMPQIGAGGGGAVNEINLILGNLRNVFLGDRRQVEIFLSEHAEVRKYETLMRVTERVAITVAIAAYFARLKRAAA